MKLIYIAGLEHSGTTLTSHLLSQHPNCLGLGEIASFFSTAHMKQYMKRWGKYPDVSLCSCGKTWRECEFWKSLVHLCGLNSDLPMLKKYKSLTEHIRSVIGEETVLIDSSKSLEVLRALIDGRSALDIPLCDISVVFNVKDVRSFVMSLESKSDVKRSFISVYRSFNLWLGANKQFLDYLKNSDINFSINLYERLCSDTEAFVATQLEKHNLGLWETMDVSHNNSHIAMGNKNFVMRNRARIQYDSRWYHDDTINLVYLIHGKARTFNKWLYSHSNNSTTRQDACASHC